MPIFCLWGEYTLFHFVQDKLANNATLLGQEWLYLFVLRICLATIGVAFLGAVTSVAALFYFMQKEGNKNGII